LFTAACLASTPLRDFRWRIIVVGTDVGVRFGRGFDVGDGGEREGGDTEQELHSWGEDERGKRREVLSTREKLGE
jgi:hypothetical protein